jgi:AFG3 family protein
MNSRVGQLAFSKDPNAGPGDKPYSDATATAMDEEARSIVDEAYKKTVELIREHKVDVEKVANLLLDKETITYDDIVELVGPRPFGVDEQYKEFVSKREAASRKEESQAEADEEDEKKEDTLDGTSGLTPGLA